MKRLLLLAFLAFGLNAARADEVPVIPEIAPVSEATIRAPLVVEKIKRGEMTAEEAWQKGDLNEDVLLFLLNQEGGDKGSLNLVDKAGLSDELVEVMVRYLPERVTKPESLSASIQYRVGDYFFKKREARGAEIFGKLLAEIRKKPAETKVAKPWYHPLVVTRLGEWHRSRGDYAAALNILTDALTVSQQANYAADWSLQAARSYRALGDKERARKFYQQAKTYGQSWYVGLALFDEARDLMAAGRHEEARQLLKQPVTGEGASMAQVSLLSLQAHSYFLTGDFEAAQQVGKEAKQLFESLSSNQKERVQTSFDLSRTALERITQWQTTPIQCKPSHLAVQGNKQQTTSLIRRFKVRTLRDVPLRVETDDKRLTARIVENDGWQTANQKREISSDKGVEKEVVVVIAPEMLWENGQSALKINSPEIPDFMVQVTMRVQ
jgi:tetratricopeptide (TPR) repeat protein